jgi:BirA family transcriptional regulator, biotin operon repressor / biotin---[acetyl-CoA-carboxylase] ligase
MSRAGEESESWEETRAEDLAEDWGVPGVHLYHSIGSTNDVARLLGTAGAPHATMVLAEEQTAGRGRAGRVWASRPNLGLWCSFVCAPPEPSRLGLLPLRIGVATAGALEEWAPGGIVRVKWPNDLLVDGRKMGGILCEAAWEGQRLDFVVVGIGLNLLHDEPDFPPEIRGQATSLSLASPLPVSRRRVARALVRTLRPILLGDPVADEELLEELRNRDALLEQEIEVTLSHDAPPLRGRGAGIGPDGALLVRTDREILAVRAGTVRLTSPLRR